MTVADQAALLDLTSDAIIVRDETGNIKFWNRGAEELYGWSREEALGRTTHELLKTQFPIELSELVKHIRQKDRWQGELTQFKKDGSQITVLSRWGLLPTKKDSDQPDLMETNTDITARKHNEDLIREQREWLRTTLNSIGDAVITTDAEGLITLMNPIAEKLTGWTFREAKHKPLEKIFRIINQETRNTVENPVDKVRRLNAVVGLANHTLLIDKTGQEIAIDDSGAPIFDPNGKLAGIILVFRDVTEQRKAEMATAQLAAIVEHSGDAIATKNLHGIIQTWNAAAERILGYKAEEIIGKSVTMLIPPDRLNEETEILGRIRSGRPFGRMETIRLAKGGRPIHVSVGVSPIKDSAGNVIGASKVLHDTTELANAREALLREKEWLHTTLTSIGDAVIATDTQGLITLMNPVAENLTGWSFKDAQGKPLAEVFRIVNQDTRQVVENPVEKVRRLNRVVGLANHTILIAKDGQERAIDDSGAPIFDPDRKLVGVVLVFRDVTQQRQLESALQSNERLALAGRLAATIAHEIHNPLDTVGNVLFLLEQQLAQQPQVAQLLKTAQGEVRRVTEISKSMLSLHRETRTASPVNLAELLRGVVNLVNETIAKGRRNITIVPGFEGAIEAYPSELRQVFTNVVKNAVEATQEKGEIKIYSEAATESGVDGVLVRVVDNGSGIPAHMQSKLFNPFVTTKEESGTGLGLWVSRSMLEKHGGSIRLSSSVEPKDPGTTVSIFLPLTIAAHKHSQSQHS
jgi:PAS domain S-box-containing protein